MNAEIRKEVTFYCEKCKKEVTVEASVVDSDETTINWHKTIYHALIECEVYDNYFDEVLK